MRGPERPCRTQLGAQKPVGNEERHHQEEFPPNICGLCVMSTISSEIAVGRTPTRVFDRPGALALTPARA